MAPVPVMTKALDAAIEELIRRVGVPDETLARICAKAVLRAALPAEPDGELLDAILMDGPIVLRARYEAKLVYGALRAHLLGEDA